VLGSRQETKTETETPTQETGESAESLGVRRSTTLRRKEVPRNAKIYTALGSRKLFRREANKVDPLCSMCVGTIWAGIMFLVSVEL
jgi:hypothetical protein